jgi:hypothetical protein
MISKHIEPWVIPIPFAIGGVQVRFFFVDWFFPQLRFLNFSQLTSMFPLVLSEARFIEHLVN